MQTALIFLHEELAMRTSLPLLQLGKLMHQQIFPPSLALRQPRELFTPNPGVPRHPALRTEQPTAKGALRLPYKLFPIIHQQPRAILVRAVEFMRRTDHGLAYRVPPHHQNIVRHHLDAFLDLDCASAVRARRAGESRPVLDRGFPDFDSYVFGDALGAELVVAGLNCEHLIALFGLRADFAEEPRRFPEFEGGRWFGVSEGRR